MVYEVSVLGFKVKTETYFWTDSVKYYVESVGESCYRFVAYNRLDCHLPFVSLREGVYESYARTSDLASLKFSKRFVYKDKTETKVIVFDQDSARYKIDSLVVDKNCRGLPKTRLGGIKIDGQVHDLINVLIYLRARDLCPGETLRVYGFAEDKYSPYWLPIVVDTEKVLVPAGTFDCWRVRYLASHCGIFDGSVGDFEVWIARDSSRIVPQMRWETKIWFKKVYITAKLKGGDKAIEGAD